MTFSSYLGGGADDQAISIAVDPGRNSYVAGYTFSTNFPIQNAFQAAFGGRPFDTFLARISDPDTNPPVILAASNYGDPAVVTMDFSEALNIASATNRTHYILDQGVTVSSVTMGINSKTVRVLTSGLTNGSTYRVTVNGVLDRAPVPCAIAPDSRVSFTALGPLPGFSTRARLPRYPRVLPGGPHEQREVSRSSDETNELHQFEVLSGTMLASAQRLSGYLLPPETGDYTFYLCSQGEAKLLLSKNESPLSLRPVAFNPGQSYSRQWVHYPVAFPTNYPPNISLPVRFGGRPGLLRRGAGA